eukprot:m.902007 g.902007  ORF g.902007 m.902007 type:complete len:234 (-) comp60061_c0_seq15:3310-4011(-)
MPSDIDMEQVRKFAQAFFHGLTVVLESPWQIQQPQELRNAVLLSTPSGPKRIATREARDRPGIQLSLDDLIDAVYRTLPTNATCAIGLTAFDMYEGSADFICGAANDFACTAVVSIARYDPLFPQTRAPKPKGKSKSAPAPPPGTRTLAQSSLLQKRTMRCIVHELCHCLGVPHCGYWSCLMQASGNVFEDDEQVCCLPLPILRRCQAETILESPTISRCTNAPSTCENCSCC